MIFERMTSLFSGLGFPVSPRARAGENLEGQTIALLGPVEVRRTAPCIVAETRVKGDRKAARDKGLQRLRDYAGGKNRARSRFLFARSVVIQEERPGLFRVRIPLPKAWNSGSPPVPLNPKVRLVEVPSEILAIEHVAHRVTPKLLAAAEADLHLWLRGSTWVRNEAENLRVREPARMLSLRPQGDVAILLGDSERKDAEALAASAPRLGSDTANAADIVSPIWLGSDGNDAVNSRYASSRH